MSDVARYPSQVNPHIRNTSDLRHRESSAKIDRAISEIWGLVAHGAVSEEYAAKEVARLMRERDADKIDAAKLSRNERRNKTLRWISSMIPPEFRHLFRGVGVLSVANYVLSQIKRCGVCHVFYAKIAAATNVSRKTVQRAIRFLRMAGMNVTYGTFSTATRKNTATVIKTTCSKLYSWLTRNVGGGGQGSPSTSIKESFYWRPARPDGAISRVARALRRKPPD